MWIVYPYDEDCSTTEEFNTRWEAAEELLCPLIQQPALDEYVCRACRNTIPRPPCSTGECETLEQAEKRCRLEDPMKWAVYDLVCSLQENKQ